MVPGCIGCINDIGNIADIVSDQQCTGAVSGQPDRSPARLAIGIQEAANDLFGHAIWCARDIVGDEPFAVLLADDLIKAQTPVLKQMIDKFDELQSSIVSVVEVDRQDTSKYGILDADPLINSVTQIRGLVEKPRPEEAPSNLAIIGRYILTPKIFEFLGKKKKGAGGEIQLTDAIRLLCETGRRVMGVRLA